MFLLLTGIIIGRVYYSQADGTVIHNSGDTVQISDYEPIDIGAIPGDSVESNRFCIGGVCKYYFTQNLQKSTSTNCSFQVPSFSLNKMVRLEEATLNMLTATGTAWTWDIATSTGTNAITTLLAKKTLTNSGVVIYLSSTTANGDVSALTGVFGTTTRQYINFAIDGGATVVPYGLDGNPIRGTCQAIFRVL